MLLQAIKKENIEIVRLLLENINDDICDTICEVFEYKIFNTISNIKNL